MISRKSCVAGWALCCVVSLAAAGEAGLGRQELSRQFSACMDTSGGVTVNMMDCIGAETQRQDVRLNHAYKEVMAQLAPARKKQLQEAQRLWLRFRDAHCRFYADPDGGTLAAVNANECYMSATAARARELEGFKLPG